MEISYLDGLGASEQENIARYISSYSVSSDSQISKVTIEEILESNIALVALADGDFAGFIRTKNGINVNNYGYSCQQVGSLVVASSFRGQAIAPELVKDMTECVVLEGIMPFAFANRQCKEIFVNNDYTSALIGEIPMLASSELGNEAMVYPISNFHKHNVFIV
jgi:hypothetical protein